MRRFLLTFTLTILLIAALLPLAMAQNRGGSSQPLKSGAPLKVVYGFDQEFPPYSFTEAGGEAVGFEVDLIRAIFKGQEVDLQLKPLAWDMIQLELAGGQIGHARIVRCRGGTGLDGSQSLLMPALLGQHDADGRKRSGQHTEHPINKTLVRKMVKPDDSTHKHEDGNNQLDCIDPGGSRFRPSIHGNSFRKL